MLKDGNSIIGLDFLRECNQKASSRMVFLLAFVCAVEESNRERY